MIPKGYDLSFPISTGHFYDKSAVCESCGEQTYTMTRIENDYPNNPDMYVCLRCLVKLEEQADHDSQS